MNKDLFNENQETFVSPNAKAFVVVPNLPEILSPLLAIANNVWWCWNSDAVELFRRLDRDLWEETYHNPKAMLGMIKQETLAALSEDDSFVSHMERVKGELDKYMSMNTWYHDSCSDYADMKFAYFSTEFAIHESLPIYSGGLGILSGDHLKSASDMGLPLVGVGLLYRYGYFKQYLNSDGIQQEEYNENHFELMPLELVKDKKNEPLIITIDIPKEKISARVWKLQVGRVPLYLLDTDFSKNSKEVREITGELYGGDRNMRIRQEILLGVGGVKLLKALNIDPGVIHINEGHSAFLLLEKMREYIEDEGLSQAEAFQLVQSGCVFTTHTPVPAGNEIFGADLVTRYFEPMYKKLGFSAEQFLALGSFPAKNLKMGNPSDFSMTILALKMTNKANGVSRLHATVAREMWSGIWPGLPRKEIPITHITNGIHTNTWISYEFAGLFDRYLGAAWKDEPADHTIWQRVAHIPDAELWRSHERRRERLVSFARARLKHQLKRRGLSEIMSSYADEVLDPEALTIGFARRFASYKRGNLIFKDLERIKKIITSKEHPVQIIIAGKAHPQDGVGKEIIKQIVSLANDPELKYKVVFLEDYDMNVAHYLVQGADIWLNNPLRPEEASGTSGMKAAVNGALNFSVLDGWWCEGYNGDNGWTIGSIDEYSDREYQDEVESKAIYDTLEKEIVPLFYARGIDGIPRGWTKKMKMSMQTLGPVFNTNRMIEEYAKKFYITSALSHEKLKKNKFEAAKKKAQWLINVRNNWKDVHVVKVEDNINGEISVFGDMSVTARVYIGSLNPEDVSVQIFSGFINSKQVVSSQETYEMRLVSKEGNDFIFEGKVFADKVGRCGYTVRILPQCGGEVQYISELIKWQ
ncbi:alpha-glucan family phosphorylase [Endomicrobium proavitum]|uniref:Alpha-glucan phosphorylase n=1 Tax=Endomicrobium proavitum TaxID=1408281 RepID=A0A0G3WI26_9BACT|nr:alpha-glucan family phosphorylase [Endomicrobium proavitum]AKL97517.1 Alpha-glucan phosphorylase [Endomicrobium proavitum]